MNPAVGKSSLRRVAVVGGFAVSSHFTKSHGSGGYKDFRLPFDSYRITNAEIRDERLAIKIDEEQCLTARGANLNVPLSATGGYGYNILGNSRRYGVVDRDAASHFGYHLPPYATDIQGSSTADSWIA